MPLYRSLFILFCVTIPTVLVLLGLGLTDVVSELASAVAMLLVGALYLGAAALLAILHYRKKEIF